MPVRASGKFVLRIPPGLHARLRQIARRSSVSLNTLCRQMIEREATRSEKDVIQPANRHFAALVQRLRNRWNRQFLGLVLFGSVARGEASDTSDVDLLIVFSADVSLTRTLYDIWDREIASGLENAVLWSPHFVHVCESAPDIGSLWYEVSLDGIVIWEKDQAVSNLLLRLRKHIAAGKVRRQMSHGQPYWVSG